jgi:hypothetical protein
MSLVTYRILRSLSTQACTDIIQHTLRTHDVSQAAGAVQECDLDCTSAHDAASRGHLGCLQLLLARHSSLALSLDANAETPLHLLDTAAHRSAALSQLLC